MFTFEGFLVQTERLVTQTSLIVSQPEHEGRVIF